MENGTLNGYDDKYCVLKAQNALEQFVQAKIISELMEEEPDPEQKAILKEIYEEEKAEFKKAKAIMDECLYVNGSNHNPIENKG